MSTIRIRTNKFTMFYTGDNDVVITNLSDGTQTYCGKESVVIVGRNIRISFLTKYFCGDILKKTVSFDLKQVIKIKKIFNLTHCLNESKTSTFATSLSETKKIICLEADKRIKECFEEIIKADCTYSRIISFMFFCTIAGIKQTIFNLILHSAATTFCNKVTDMIESDISKKWTLRIIAEEFHLSEVAIRKKLESEGVCFRDLMLEIRMKEALSLLITGDFSVSQISTGVGYHNPSYFISYFKSFFGVTPKQLQAMLRK
ncbi:AraC family transcriptional regulator (plasmid) [Escherichia coli]|uniref:helix-turn-helix transcriptional regulator n=1 Tax=Escherichia coli TaxID=562 RepID=UPI0010CBE56A|nr:AraC family transcriptional regulator [Escherichia coli]GCY74525.1 transcriptional activator of the bfp operon PerA [Escherichia coli]